MSSATTNAPSPTLTLPDLPWRKIVWLIWLAALILGTIGVLQRVLHGHLPAGYGSYVPWGLWVALYFHGVGIAGGAYVIGALGFILDWPGFGKPSTLRMVIVLSVAAILPSFAGVWFDLGRMERSMNIFFSPSFTSMMAFNAWMYGAFMAVAAICWILSYRSESTWLKPWLCLGMLFSVLFPSQSGAFFGVVDARPFWHSALLPILFLTSALTAGAATLMVVRALSAEADDEQPTLAAVARLRILTLIGMVAYFGFEFAEFSIALWNPMAHSPALELILWGPYWWVFWFVHILLGGVIPAVLLASRRPGAWLLGGALVAVAFISARLNVLVPGQAVGEIEGLQQAFHHERLRYIYDATTMEYLVGFFLLAIGITVFHVGQRLSDLLARSRTA